MSRKITWPGTEKQVVAAEIKTSPSYIMVRADPSPEIPVRKALHKK
jgi:hypothetical protein